MRRRLCCISVTSLVYIVGQILSTGLLGTSIAHYSADMFDTERAHLLDKKMRKLFHKLFRRKLKVPPRSTLSLSTQVSRPNIFPRVLNQDEGIIVDGVLEWPMWSKRCPSHFYYAILVTSLEPTDDERCLCVFKWNWISLQRQCMANIRTTKINNPAAHPKEVLWESKG